MALEDRLDRPHRLRGALARQRVLHLREAHEPRAGEHAEGAVDALAPRAPPRAANAVERRDRGREAAAGAAHGLEGAVVDQHLAHPLARARRRRGRASVGVFVRVSATAECGKVQNSKCSWRSARSCRSARTSSSGSGRSTPCSAKAGTQRSVTATTAPSVPSPTRAARSRSPSARGQRPLLPARQDELHGLHLRRQVGMAQAGAVRRRWRGRRRASGRRCRRGWAARGRARRARR